MISSHSPCQFVYLTFLISDFLISSMQIGQGFAIVQLWSFLENLITSMVSPGFANLRTFISACMQAAVDPS